MRQIPQAIGFDQDARGVAEPVRPHSEFRQRLLNHPLLPVAACDQNGFVRHAAAQNPAGWRLSPIDPLRCAEVEGQFVEILDIDHWHRAWFLYYWG
jgi:hypothetical protein